MSKKWYRDVKGEIQKYVTQLVKTEFKELRYAQFLCAFTEEPEFDDEGMLKIATIQKLSNKQRDLYGDDFLNYTQ